MAKAKAQYKKVSLHATNQHVSVPVSSWDRTKLGIIAKDKGVDVDELLRHWVKKLIDQHRQVKANIVKF